MYQREVHHTLFYNMHENAPERILGYGLCILIILPPPSQNVIILLTTWRGEHSPEIVDLGNNQTIKAIMSMISANWLSQWFFSVNWSRIHIVSSIMKLCDYAVGKKSKSI